MGQETATADPITGESTEKTSTESSGQTKVEGQASQGEQDNAGQSQDQSEGGKEQGTDTRRPFRSKNQTIYELRQKLRDQEGSFRSYQEETQKQLDELRAQMQNRGQDRKPSRTFWEAPEEVMDERFETKLTAMEKRILDRLEQRESQIQQTAALKQETSEAIKFINSQKGITEDDHADIEEIVRSTPEMQAMSPMQRAKYAMFLWKEQHGISDKSELKAKAATVVGGPHGQGPKELTESEINRRLSEFPQDVSKWSKADHDKWQILESEIRKSQERRS